MADEYDIYVRGFAPGPETPEHALHRVFGIEPERARELVHSLPRVVKRRLSAEQVVRYELALRHLRADYELRQSPLRPSQITIIGAEHGGAVGAQDGSTLSLPPPPAAPAALPTRAATTVRDHVQSPREVGLDVDDRPGWILDAPAPRAAEPPRTIADENAAVVGPPPGAARTSPRPRSFPAADHAYRVGTVAGVESLGSAPNKLIRAAVSIAVGLSLLLIAVAVARHYGLLERGVLERAAFAPLRSAAGLRDEAPAPEDDPLMPIALDWAQSDLHQFSNGDKERVRVLIAGFLRAGARAVRAGHIMPSGQLQIAAELVVVLPRDPSERQAVFAEYERFLRSAFGEFVAPPKDDGTGLLRVAL